MVSLQYFEDLQETLLRLERALQQERRERRENDVIVEGLEALLGANSQQEVFDILHNTFHRLVDCSHCWVMQQQGDRLVSEMTDLTFPIHQAFARVLSGKVLNAYDVQEISEWQGQCVNVRSALHLPLFIGGNPGMLIVGSEKKAAFSRNEVELAQRIIPFAEHAAEKIYMLELKHAKELDEQRKLMQAILDHAPIGVWMLDANLRIAFVNRTFCEVLGVNEEQFLQANHYSEVLPEPVSRQFMASDERCFKEGGMVRSQEIIPCADGRDHAFDVIKVSLHGEDGAIRGIVGICVDVSEKLALEHEREQMQKQLLHAQKLESLGVLAGGIAHDFNNILAAILGHASMAEKKIHRDPLAVKHHLDVIIQSSEKAADLCKQMLAYSGRGKFNIEPINLSKLIEDIVNILEISLNKGVVLKLSLLEHLPKVEADASQMQQIIMNLITNANEAIGNRSGVIAVRTGVMNVDQNYLRQCHCAEDVKPGRFVFLEVSDTGCGMSRAILEKIFDPFFTTKFTGRGLGMSAVLGIVRGHHGALRIYSEPGSGTTVRILLPPLENTVAAGDKDSSMGLGLDKQLPGVLVVDDEESIREMAAMMLRDIGFTDIRMAEDGEEAVQLYEREQQHIGLVLLDLTMPHMDGEETYRRLRMINPAVRVILSSGYSESDIKDRFAGKGLCGFLQKPFRPDDLQAAVKKALDLHQELP